MKIEKLFCSFHVGTGKLLSMIVTRGNERLAPLSQKLLARFRPRARGAKARVILDAGAAENHAQLLELADGPNQATIVRTPRRPGYRKRWAALPKEAWKEMEEPGPYSNAPPKRIRIAETRMTVKGAGHEKNVRTIVICERGRRGKERWHALWVFGDEDSDAYELVREFRQRQDHEQTYRIMLHDAFVDTAPSGYDKASPNLRRPGFRQNALTIYAWIAALATNTLGTLTASLPSTKRLGLPRGFARAHIRTVRRWLLQVSAEIYQGEDTLIVLLAPRRLHALWAHLVERANRAPVRIPWLGNRRLILSLAASRRGESTEASTDPGRALRSVWC